MRAARVSHQKTAMNCADFSDFEYIRSMCSHTVYTNYDTTATTPAIEVFCIRSVSSHRSVPHHTIMKKPARVFVPFAVREASKVHMCYLGARCIVYTYVRFAREYYMLKERDENDEIAGSCVANNR